MEGTNPSDDWGIRRWAHSARLSPHLVAMLGSFVSRRFVADTTYIQLNFVSGLIL
jgi:hypothetical protein